MARTRANQNREAQVNGAGRGGRGGRGGGRGGRGGGRGNGVDPDIAAFVAEQWAAAIPTIVTQVTAAMGRAPEVAAEPEQGNLNEEGFNPEVEFVGEDMYVGPGPRRYVRNAEATGGRR